MIGPVAPNFTDCLFQATAVITLPWNDASGSPIIDIAITITVHTTYIKLGQLSQSL